MNVWTFENDNFVNLLLDISPTDKDTFGFEYHSFDIPEFFKYEQRSFQYFPIKIEMKITLKLLFSIAKRISTYLVVIFIFPQEMHNRSKKISP